MFGDSPEAFYLWLTFLTIRGLRFAERTPICRCILCGVN